MSLERDATLPHRAVKTFLAVRISGTGFTDGSRHRRWAQLTPPVAAEPTAAFAIASAGQVLHKYKRFERRIEQDVAPVGGNIATQAVGEHLDCAPCSQRIEEQLPSCDARQNSLAILCLSIWVTNVNIHADRRAMSPLAPRRNVASKWVDSFKELLVFW